ncbi:transcriptional regulator [Sporosarcina sp. P19]|uniref:ArsR/SmtB family transcription factor n=1 Tax=Sporosarcina sp. P19 TaxID=2048258 RepID=UPI000C17005B|nr:metalloregulator ArsR/SmtB family transcription factor [Sporosarcina sp. P19]PIC77845.1 transcriptional regulator [Sporosarcina sp. P19]
MSDKKHERDIYVAIADPTRRKLLHLLAEADELPLYELTSKFQMGRTAISKHLAILKEAGLVTVRKVGRETRYRINAAPLQEIKDWVTFYENFWVGKVSQLKKVLLEE